MYTLALVCGNELNWTMSFTWRLASDWVLFIRFPFPCTHGFLWFPFLFAQLSSKHNARRSVTYALKKCTRFVYVFAYCSQHFSVVWSSCSNKFPHSSCLQEDFRFLKLYECYTASTTATASTTTNARTTAVVTTCRLPISVDDRLVWLSSQPLSPQVVTMKVVSSIP